MTLKLAGRNTAFAVDAYDLTGNYNEYKFKRDADLIDVTTFGQRFSDYLSGIQKSRLDLKGFYTPGAGAVDQIVHQRFGQDPDVNVALCPGGYEAGDPAILMPTTITKYDLSTKLKDAVHIDSEFAIRGAVDNGYILLSPKIPTSGTTGGSSVLDNGSAGSSVAGCTGQIHVFSSSGTTPTLAVKVQHSNDSGATWVDLITFATVVPATASTLCQRIVLPFGTTVYQQVKMTWTATGTNPAFKILGGFARGVDYS